MVAKKKNILKVINKYDEVDEHLRKHEVDFPTADYLRSITFEGLGNNHHINIKWGCCKQPWQDIIGKGKDHIRVESMNHFIDGIGKASISRWSKDFQAEFKERADWMLP